MAHTILTSSTVTVSELKKNPKKAVSSADGEPVAVLSHSVPQFYCVPPDLFEAWQEIIEDFELAQIAKSRIGGDTIKVSLDEL